jgi:hypothetical protein
METNKYYTGILILNKIIHIKIQAIPTPSKTIKTTRIIETTTNLTSISSL